MHFLFAGGRRHFPSVPAFACSVTLPAHQARTRHANLAERKGCVTHRHDLLASSAVRSRVERAFPAPPSNTTLRCVVLPCHLLQDFWRRRGWRRRASMFSRAKSKGAAARVAGAALATSSALPHGRPMSASSPPRGGQARMPCSPTPCPSVDANVRPMETDTATLVGGKKRLGHRLPLCDPTQPCRAVLMKRNARSSAPGRWPARSTLRP